MSAKPILKLVTCHRGQAARFLLRTRPNGAGLTRINTGSLKGCWRFRHPQGRVTIMKFLPGCVLEFRRVVRIDL